MKFQTLNKTTNQFNQFQHNNNNNNNNINYFLLFKFLTEFICKLCKCKAIQIIKYSFKIIPEEL